MLIATAHCSPSSLSAAAHRLLLLTASAHRSPLTAHRSLPLAAATLAAAVTAAAGRVATVVAAAVIAVVTAVVAPVIAASLAILILPPSPPHTVAVSSGGEQ